MEGRLKFDDSKPEMRVDTDPFEVNSSYAKPELLGVNMVGFHSFEFDTALGDFEANVRQVILGVGKGLLDFLMQQKLKDRDVSMCPCCNAVFDVEAAEIFEKEKMKKELSHREEPLAALWMGEVNRHKNIELREREAYEAHRQARRETSRGRFGGPQNGP
ncbi:hypothetical protein PIB30_091479 [Stylosanthes scabra]|uniref:Uncharacterized protein n=1 Tax=Stylosanthes scabra TaxID=79078 RepID=A0ABU6QV85_9FABA|nr:hypothetical protein [Stylosanthes scabra]